MKDKRKVFLAICSHFGFNDFEFVQSLVALCAETIVHPDTSVEFAPRWNTDPSVERARNILTADFLESDCTHILFVDSDIQFAPGHVARICSHDVDVVGGMYAIKSQRREVKWCLNAMGHETPARDDGLIPVKYTGTGFMCIRRAVFDKMRKHLGSAFEYKQDFGARRAEYAYWRQGVSQGRFLTEDWMFCQTWLDCGGQIFVDGHVILRHAGRAVWPLPLQDNNPFTPKAQSPAPRASN